jgi:hypothetical protein
MLTHCRLRGAGQEALRASEERCAGREEMREEIREERERERERERESAA